MPSPFPGMDPYLEDPALWPDVHHRLIVVASEFLLAALRPKYFVQIDERLYVADMNDDAWSLIVPDMHIREVETAGEPAKKSGPAAVVEPGIEIDSTFKMEVRESRLKIIDREKNEVVTVLEILSPANKVRGSAGHRSYEEKKEEVLGSETHFVEIDLLRSGERRVNQERFKPFDYFALVWRWTPRVRRTWVWPMRLTERLKAIPIPLRDGEIDAVLDIQAVLNTAYERAGYELRVDYKSRPHSPVTQELEPWLRQTIGDAK